MRASNKYFSPLQPKRLGMRKIMLIFQALRFRHVHSSWNSTSFLFMTANANLRLHACCARIMSRLRELSQTCRDLGRFLLGTADEMIIVRRAVQGSTGSRSWSVTQTLQCLCLESDQVTSREALNYNGEYRSGGKGQTTSSGFFCFVRGWYKQRSTHAKSRQARGLTCLSFTLTWLALPDPRFDLP